MDITVNLILRLITLGIGLFFMVEDFLALARRKMADLLVVSWMIISVIFIMFGIIPVLGTWTYFVSLSTGLTLLATVALILYFLFRVCYWISDLFWQNKELSLQISLLNQENEEMRRRMNAVENILAAEDNSANNK